MNYLQWLWLTETAAITVLEGLDNKDGLDNTLLGVDITWQAEVGEDMDPANDLNIITLHLTWNGYFWVF